MLKFLRVLRLHKVLKVLKVLRVLECALWVKVYFLSASFINDRGYESVIGLSLLNLKPMTLLKFALVK